MVPADRLARLRDRLPPDWPVVPIKYVCSINRRSLPESTDNDFTFRYIDIGGVDSPGKWTASEHMRFEDAPSRARRLISTGDVLIATVRTYLRAVAVVSEVSEPLVASTGFAVLTPGPRVTPSYLGYWTRSDGFIDEMVARSTGVSYPAINPDDIGNLSFPSIDTGLQQTIAAFLDRETARIDSIIQLKQRQIELLEEKRVALIAQATTKGLNPNVKMKDSGVEWLGEIPEHWQVMRGKYLMTEFDSRSKLGDGEPLSVSHINGVTKRSETNATMFLPESFVEYKNVEAGDLVVNTMWAWMGAMGTAPQAGIVSPSYNTYRFRRTIAEPWYYDALVRTPRFAAVAASRSTGVWSSRMRLYPEVLGSIVFPVPPTSEQKQIARELRSITEASQRLASLVAGSVRLLHEYRSSLISAAVTGQIDVRGEVSAP